MSALEITTSALLAAMLGTVAPRHDSSAQVDFDYVRFAPEAAAQAHEPDDLRHLDATHGSTDQEAAKSSCARFIWWSRNLPAYRLRICVQPTGPAPDPTPMRATLRF